MPARKYERSGNGKRLEKIRKLLIGQGTPENIAHQFTRKLNQIKTTKKPVFLGQDARGNLYVGFLKRIGNKEFSVIQITEEVI